ncbi:MAG TPA: hypothetical protein VHJ69_11835 [Gemmatimonadales bacterium]|nr:hypothetical protein [Gemmatimonadales bacterium]
MTDPTPRAASNGRMRAALVLLLVALFGGIAGVAFDRLLLLPRMFRGPGFGHDPRTGPPHHMDRMRDRFSRELGLSEEQQAKVDSIMSRQMLRMDSIRDEVQPRMDSSFAQARRAIDSVLTPEQRKKAAALRRRMPGPPPGLPGPRRGHPPPPPR